MTTKQKFYEAEFAVVLVPDKYKPTLKIMHTSGETKWLSVSLEQLLKIKAILMEEK